MLPVIVSSFRFIKLNRAQEYADVSERLFDELQFIFAFSSFLEQQARLVAKIPFNLNQGPSRRLEGDGRDTRHVRIEEPGQLFSPTWNPRQQAPAERLVERQKRQHPEQVKRRMEQGEPQ